MQSFPNKRADERRYLRVGFVRQLADDETLLSLTVTPTVHSTSAVPDPNPAGVLSGDPEVIETEQLIKNVLNPARQSVGQWAEGGVPGCTYKISFKPVTSRGEKPIEDVLLHLSADVPS